jgi:hypothetical protein
MKEVYGNQGLGTNRRHAGNRLLAQAGAVHYHNSIEAARPQEHGFHRLLPHLWKLFSCALVFRP